MAARFGCDIHNLSGIEIFVPILSLLAISAAWARQTDIGKAWAEAPSAFGAQGSGSSLQPRHHPSLGMQASLASGSRERRSANAALGLQSTGLVLSGTYSAGCAPETIAVGDLNDDGRPDLVVADWYLTCSGVFGTGKVSVLLGNGGGAFQEPLAYSSGGFQALAVEIAGLNGDGKLDLVVANSCAGDPSGNCANGGTGQIGVLLGNGDGSFETAVSYSSGGVLAHATVMANVNGDGHSDVIVGNSCAQDCNNGNVGVLLGSGDGSLQPAVTYAGGDQSDITSLAVGDLNGDGRVDVVLVGGQGTGVVSELMGNGEGRFQPLFSYPWGGYAPKFGGYRGRES